LTENFGADSVSQESRYELLERVGTGSFATVYRANDTDLKREVAVKKIHDQFLELPEQMERYWQEAQLLASLQHPNVITFFDIDKERGWLIMELMQGNLSQRIAGQAMDLKSIRTSLAHCLRALKYLHSRGIVHGDIKPSNMMIDSRKRVKVGDFGLARRVSDEDGSLLRGTTKYMAPEVVSEDFGEVGPASDLYSLGFAAYELMCGPNFETLFPGLSAFGRDKQVAWMMWHAAKDRRLPEIDRVLQGVPNDLKMVVEKLIEKDQSKRYQSAEDALSDLNIDVKIINKGGNQEEEEEPQGINRTVAIVSFACSVILSLVIAFMPSGNGDPKQEVAEQKPDIGVVGHVDADKGFFIVEVANGEKAERKEIQFGNSPKILLNGKTYITPRELKPGDRVTVKSIKDESGDSRQHITAARPAESKGFIVAVQPQIDQIVVQVTEGSQRTELVLALNTQTTLSLNGFPGKVADLRPKDQITVRHIPEPNMKTGRLATELVALQNRPMTGFLRDITPERLTVEASQQGRTELVKLPFAQECNVTINGKQIVDGRLLKPEDLKPGDRVTLTHHLTVVEVHALRKSLFSGQLLNVQEGASSIVAGGENNERKLFVVGAESSITINGASAGLGDLRRNDRIEVTFDSADAQNDVSAIDALRPIQKNRYAIVIGVSDYDDNNLTRVSFAANDAKLVHQTLINRYACPPENVLLLVDETRVRVQQALPDWIKKTGPTSELLVYFSGHAYVDEMGEPFLAFKDFDLKTVAQSGISLSWLRQLLEDCPADEKILLLDTCHAGEGLDLDRQPEPGKLLATIKPEKDPGVFRSTYGIASCDVDQRGLVWGEKAHGLFGWCLSEGLSGLGDKNQDVHLEPTELFDYLSNRMAKIEIDKKFQKPVLFTPDDSAPEQDRLSPSMKEVVRNLLANHWNERRLAPATTSEFLGASRLLGEEPDAKMAYAVILMKSSKWPEAQKYWAQVKLSKKEPLSYVGLAYCNSYNDRHASGLGEITELAGLILEAKVENPELTDDEKRALDLAGSLRQFAVVAAEEARRLKESDAASLDKVIELMDDEAKAVYQNARDAVDKKLANYKKMIEAEAGSSKGRLLELEGKRLTSYYQFDYDQVRRLIVEGLDK
jgi:eukaryotic-like serine/threonine-protein kinase